MEQRSTVLSIPTTRPGGGSCFQNTLARWADFGSSERDDIFPILHPSPETAISDLRLLPFMESREKGTLCSRFPCGYVSL